jgi:hypothetical protein
MSLAEISAGLQAETVIPYLGPGVLDPGQNLPVSAEQLAKELAARVAVPHRLHGNLSAVAQYIESFKHRKTLLRLLGEIFKAPAEPCELHRFLAQLPEPVPLIVDAWYTDAMAHALFAQGRRFGWVQGVSRADCPGEWVRYYRTDGTAASPEEAQSWPTLLYQPLGSVAPAGQFVVSDSDYVEILTEIDIQTPIPERVKELRRGRQFLFLGCRFATQLERIFARQIAKRSAGRHFAVISGELTRNEARFLEEQRIARIDLPLGEFLARLKEEIYAQAKCLSWR